MILKTSETHRVNVVQRAHAGLGFLWCVGSMILPDLTCMISRRKEWAWDDSEAWQGMTKSYNTMIYDLLNLWVYTDKTFEKKSENNVCVYHHVSQCDIKKSVASRRRRLWEWTHAIVPKIKIGENGVNGVKRKSTKARLTTSGEECWQPLRARNCWSYAGFVNWEQGRIQWYSVIIAVS